MTNLGVIEAKSSRTRRAGFTLIELLVTLFILGLLVALLLQAIQSAREAGRRIQSVNHLRQLGLAVANYQSVSGVNPPVNTFKSFSIHVELLSLMERHIFMHHLISISTFQV